MKGFSIRKKNCKQFFSVNSNKKYLQAAIFSSPLTDMLFCCNRSRFHNKKTPDPGNKTGTRVYFPRCHPDCSEHPPNLLNSYKGLTLPTFIGSLESGTFSFLRRFAPTTVWHNDPKKRGTLSAIMDDVRQVCRDIEKKDGWLLTSYSAQIVPDDTTSEPLMHGIINATFRR